MATGRVPTTANSPLTAKGDLFGYSTTQARVPVGNDGETIVADSSTSTGLRYQQTMAAGKNAIINGGMDIWQRGTSSTASGSYGAADRWWQLIASGSCTYSRESTIIPSGSQYSLKLLSGGAGTNAYAMQAIETANAIRYAGQTVILSAQVASSASVSWTCVLSYSTAVDTAVGGSWTDITPTSGGTATTTSTTFSTITGVFAVPSTAKSFRLHFLAGSMASGTAAYLGNTQLEIGSVATAFTRAGGSIQGELAACQRYYYRTGGQQYTFYGNAIAQNATSTYTSLPLPVTMRTTAASIDYQTAVNYRLQGSTAFNVTAISLSGVGDGLNTAGIVVTVASGLTAGNYYQFLSNNSTATYIGISAEL
jgi:hypothetical protein